MVWGVIIGLSAAAAALAAYALWPWAANRQPKTPYCLSVILLALAILAGPGLAYYRASRQTEQPVDVAADFPGGNGKKFIWNGPVGTGGDSPHQTDTSLETMTARLAKRLEAQPDDINGWVLLARSYVAMGDIDRAKKIFGDIIAKWPKNTEVRVAYGEMLMALANGTVTPEARTAFEAAAAADPRHIRAQYDLALADSQQGKTQAAYDRWLRLAKSAPANAQWLPDVAARLQETAAKLGIAAPKFALPAPPPPPAMPGPSAAQMRAASDMSPAERAAFIRGMVEGLAQKLNHNPNDLQGWLRLGRSYGVLGDWEKAKAAYRDGLKAFPGNPDLTQALAKIPKQARP
jgi:cytochrome c-type biogenesis protein CcmH